VRAVSVILRDSAGLTMVEVLIALGVITVGLVALFAAMPLGTSLIGESNRKTIATFLAQQRMEQIKNARWTLAPPDTLGGAESNGTAAVAQWPDEDYGTDASYPGFRRAVRIADCSVVSCSGIAIGTVGINTMRQVAVTVFFRPLAGTGMTQAAEESVQLVTLIAKR
jgi:Tfp pilus assembly protein PilE